MHAEKAYWKKLDGNCTRMQQAILSKYWKQQPTKQQLYGHLLPISKTIQIRQTWHAGPCWRSNDELINDVLLWTPSHGRTSVAWPAKTYLQQFWTDTGCSLEDLPQAVDDRDKWWERERERAARHDDHDHVCILYQSKVSADFQNLLFLILKLLFDKNRLIIWIVVWFAWDEMRLFTCGLSAYDEYVVSVHTL